jgi:methionyl-tRNA formyltransferase
MPYMPYLTPNSQQPFILPSRSRSCVLKFLITQALRRPAVWYGTFNLHASLLPQYRGAAPINWAIINGEKQTGITTFLLNHEIDKGAIIEQQAVDILPEDNIGSLYDKLMHCGAGLVLRTVDKIAEGGYETIEQMHVDENTLRPAPKIFKEDGRVDWSRNVVDIHNLVRGLSPYPAAWSPILKNGEECGSLKIFTTHIEPAEINVASGSVKSDGKSYVAIAASDGWVYLDEVQMAGKRRMAIKELLLGWRDVSEVSFA